MAGVPGYTITIKISGPDSTNRPVISNLQDSGTVSFSNNIWEFKNASTADQDITISASGFKNYNIPFSSLSEGVTLNITMALIPYVSNLSDGTNTYIIKDSNAVHLVDSQEPTSSNNYTWYRLYDNGWVEQGGIAASTTTSGGVFSQVVTLPKAMTDTNYIVLANPYRNNDFVAYEGFYMAVTTYCTTTTVHLRTYGYNTSQYIDGVRWEVKGYAA